MQAIIDIGDQKTGSKSRQALLKMNADELYKNGVYCLRSTKVGNYDMGLAAYAGRENHIKTFKNKNNYPDGINFDSFLEEKISEEIKASDCDRFVFSFEGLMHLKVGEIKKLTSMLYRYFSEVFIVGFVRRQDRHAVSSYTTRLKNGGATDKNVLFNPNGIPRGTPVCQPESIHRLSELSSISEPEVQEPVSCRNRQPSCPIIRSRRIPSWRNAHVVSSRPNTSCASSQKPMPASMVSSGSCYAAKSSTTAS